MNHRQIAWSRRLTVAMLGFTLAACGTPGPITSGPITTRPSAQPSASVEPSASPIVDAQPSAQPSASAQPAPIIGFSPKAGGPGTAVELFGTGAPAGKHVVVRLGMPSATGEVLVSAVADAQGRWSARLVMPDRLPSGEIIPTQQLRLVLMDEHNQALASAPFAYTAAEASQAPAPTYTPASDPNDAVRRFLSAIIADRSGTTALPYLTIDMRRAIGSGQHTIDSLLNEQNPFTAFEINGIVHTPDQKFPYTVVEAVLAYGDHPTPAATRHFSIAQEQGEWRIGTVASVDAPIPAREAASDVVRAMLADWKNDLDVGQYLSLELRDQLLKGRTIDEALGLRPHMLEAFEVSAPENRPSEVLFVPAVLSYGEINDVRTYELVVENGQWRISGSSLQRSEPRP